MDVLVLADSVSILISREVHASEKYLNWCADILFFEVLKMGRETNGNWHLVIAGEEGAKYSPELALMLQRNLMLMVQPTKNVYDDPAED